MGKSFLLFFGYFALTFISLLDARAMVLLSDDCSSFSSLQFFTFSSITSYSPATSCYSNNRTNHTISVNTTPLEHSILTVTFFSTHNENITAKAMIGTGTGGNDMTLVSKDLYYNSESEPWWRYTFQLTTNEVAANSDGVNAIRIFHDKTDFYLDDLSIEINPTPFYNNYIRILNPSTVAMDVDILDFIDPDKTYQGLVQMRLRVEQDYMGVIDLISIYATPVKLLDVSCFDITIIDNGNVDLLFECRNLADDHAQLLVKNNGASDIFSAEIEIELKLKTQLRESAISAEFVDNYQTIPIQFILYR